MSPHFTHNISDIRWELLGNLDGSRQTGKHACGHITIPTALINFDVCNPVVQLVQLVFKYLKTISYEVFWCHCLDISWWVSEVSNNAELRTTDWSHEWASWTVKLITFLILVLGWTEYVTSLCDKCKILLNFLFYKFQQPIFESA